MTQEVIRTGADATFFGAIGYGCMEGLKQGIAAFRTSKLAYLGKEPQFFTNVTSLNPLQIGGICALFVVVDLVAKKALQELYGNQENIPIFIVGRLAASIAVTGVISALLGATPGVGFACGVIVIAMAIYAFIQKVAGAFHWGRYSTLGPTRMDALV
jgi:hypothetical protein